MACVRILIADDHEMVRQGLLLSTIESIVQPRSGSASREPVVLNS